MEGIKDFAVAAASKMKCQHLLSALLQLEQRYNTTSNSSTTQAGDSSSLFVLQYKQTTMRQSIVHWYEQVITSIGNDEAAGLPRDVSFIAIRLLDRVVGATPSFDLSNLKLIAFTCLYVAIKIYYKKCGLMNTNEERRAFLLIQDSIGAVSIPRLLELTSLTTVISEEQVRQIEVWMLQQVNWSICPLTPGLFMKCIIPCIDWTLFEDNHGLQQRVLETSLCLGALATQDSFFIPYNVSAIGLTCVITAASIETQQDSSSLSESVLQAFAPLLKHTVEELQELHVLCLKLFELHNEHDGASSSCTTTSRRKQETTTATSSNNDGCFTTRNDDPNGETTVGRHDDAITTSNSSSSSSSSLSAMMDVSMDTSPSSLGEETNEPNVDDEDLDDDVLPSLEDVTRQQQHHHQIVQQQQQPQQHHHYRIANNTVVHVIPYEHNEI